MTPARLRLRDELASPSSQVDARAAGVDRRISRRTRRPVSICLCRKEAPLLERKRQIALRFTPESSAWHSPPTSRCANRGLPCRDDYARSHSLRSRRLGGDREVLED